MLSRLGQYFNVVWLNPANEWRDATRQNNIAVRHECPLEHIPGFSVCTPAMWSPHLYRPRWLAERLFSARLRAARQELSRRGSKKIVLYLCRPNAKAALRLVRHDFSCYHIDDDYSFSDIETPTSDTERQLIQEVDHVFLHSPAIMEKKGHINPNSSLIPNGVDFAAYAERKEEPEDLRPIGRPRIGYTGALKRQLDWELMARLADAHPDWSLIFVGPRSPHEETSAQLNALADRRNCHFLGSKSIEEISSYPQHFDVCIMPYRKTAYTRYIYPLKLHEYLASGRPVVSTRLESLAEFENVVALVDEPAEWETAITRALSGRSDDSQRAADRRAVARRFDWDLLVSELAETLTRRLHPGFTGRAGRTA